MLSEAALVPVPGLRLRRLRRLPLHRLRLRLRLHRLRPSRRTKGNT